MSDESVTDEQQARTEFERAMRGCRRLVQERMTPKIIGFDHGSGDYSVEVHGIVYADGTTTITKHVVRK